MHPSADARAGARRDFDANYCWCLQSKLGTPHSSDAIRHISLPIPHPCLFRVYLFIFLCAFYFEGSQSIERKAKVLAFSSHTLECCRSVVMMCMGWFGWMEIDDDSSVRSLFCCCLLCVPTVFKQSNRWCSTHRTISITARTTHLSLHMLFSCQPPLLS